MSQINGNTSFCGNAYTARSMETEKHMWENVDYMRKNNFSQEKIDAATRLAVNASKLTEASIDTDDNSLGQKLDLVLTNSDVILSRIARPEC